MIGAFHVVLAWLFEEKLLIGTALFAKLTGAGSSLIDGGKALCPQATTTWRYARWI
jgi:hypothetical protein